MLGADREGDMVVIELKRDRTPRDTLAQALEYASFIEDLDSEQISSILRNYLGDESGSLAECHRDYFNIKPEETVAFNKDQRIVIIGQDVTDEIRQTSSFLRKKGLRVTCIEFSFFQAEGGLKLLSHEIVIGREPLKISKVESGSRVKITEEEFIDSLDKNGKQVFRKTLDHAADNSLPVHSEESAGGRKS